MEPLLIVAQAEPDWIKFINSVGVPVTLLFAGVLMIWKAGSFVAPLLKEFFSSHVELAASLKDTTAKQTSILESQANTLSDHGEKLDQIHRKVVGP